MWHPSTSVRSWTSNSRPAQAWARLAEWILSPCAPAGAAGSRLDRDRRLWPPQGVRTPRSCWATVDAAGSAAKGGAGACAGKFRQQKREREQSTATTRELPARQVGERTAPVSAGGDRVRRGAEHVYSTHEVETRARTARARTRTPRRARQGARGCAVRTRTSQVRTEHDHAAQSARQARTRACGVQRAGKQPCDTAPET
eukprot:1868338-Pleurochrysis_carterae.AAC.1